MLSISFIIKGKILQVFHGALDCKMNEIKNRDLDQDLTPTTQGNRNGYQSSDNIGVYDRPERRGPSAWLFLLLFLLLLVVTVVIFQVLL
jgi:hypothetical protein